MKLLLSGGGTGGHIYPALAIAEEMQRVIPEIETLYVGTEDGREAELVPRTGLPFTSIHVKGMPRKISLDMIPFGFALLGALSESKKIVREFRPDLAIGTGGFVSGPIIYQAAKRGIYSLIHEQNSYPGVANRILSRYIDDVAITFEESEKFFHDSARATKTGNPIRSVFFSLHRTKELYEKFSLDPERKTIFVFGGSNGHDRINEAIGEMLDALAASPYQLVLVTGPEHYDLFLEKHPNVPHNVKIHRYLFDIQEMYALTDLMVTSSGAITLAELQAAGIAPILIPKAYTTENHQLKNARATEDKGAAIVIEEDELTGTLLFDRIDGLLSDEERLQRMKIASRSLGTPNAAKEIVALALSGWEKKVHNKR